MSDKLEKAIKNIQGLNVQEGIDEMELALDELSSALIKFGGEPPDHPITLDDLLSLIAKSNSSRGLREAQKSAAFLVGVCRRSGYFGQGELPDSLLDRAATNRDTLVKGLEEFLDLKG